MTSVAASAIAIFVALILFFILCYKGIGVIPCSILCAAIVALTTEDGLFGTLLGSFMTSTGNYVANMFLPFVFGGMFAALMTATGASEIIGKYLIGKFGARFAPYAIMGSVMLLALGGVSAFPFIIAPLAFSVLKAADLPRQIGAVIMAGTYSLVGYLIPGATNTANVIASNSYGTTLYAGAGMGITCFIIGIVLVVIYIEFMIRTYRKNGVGYTPSPTEIPTAARADDDMPKFFMAVLPILIVFVLTMVLQLGLGWRSTQAVILALFVGTAFLYLTNWNRIHEKNKFDPITKGMMNAMVPLANTAIIVGFAGVVTGTAAYTAMVEKLLSIDANPYVTVVIAVAAICALCADAIGGVSTFATTLGQTFLGMGVDPNALHRLTLATATTFDSMPHNGSLNVTMQVMGLTHKEVYKNICVVQILIPSIYTAVALIMAICLY
jgi:H+/gluconate symporter-like permease